MARKKYPLSGTNNHAIIKDHIFPPILVNMNWNSWPVSAWMYALCFCHVLGQLHECTGVSIKVGNEYNAFIPASSISAFFWLVWWWIWNQFQLYWLQGKNSKWDTSIAWYHAFTHLFTPMDKLAYLIFLLAGFWGVEGNQITVACWNFSYRNSDDRIALMNGECIKKFPSIALPAQFIAGWNYGSSYKHARIFLLHALLQIIYSLLLCCLSQLLCSKVRQLKQKGISP